MMKLRIVAWAALLLLATPASAERLMFDHRLSPPLKAVLDADDPEMIDFNDSNPRYVTDLIAVRGRSASDWIEALLIIARTPDQRGTRTALQWSAELRAEAERRCQSAFSVIAEDAVSVTFQRTSTGCPADYPQSALYRVVAGSRSLFLLAVMARDNLTDQSRQEWLSLLASAHLE
jgi:hypothetical protein